MAIDIKNLTNRSIVNQRSSNTAGAVRGNARSSGPSPQSSGNSDRVSLTGSATLLQALEDQINSLPIVDINRVRETRYALATGSHQIDTFSTANNMLAAEQALAQKK